MKIKIFMTLFLLQVPATYLLSQIPNNGFELWNDKGTYMDPQDYKTANSSSAGLFYPVMRSTDHYPATVGNYSIKIESNVPLLPNFSACGVAFQTYHTLLEGPGPYFPVSGHPANFTGYYKYFPQNNDTAEIMLVLFQGGEAAAIAMLTVTAAVPDWTSFVIPITPYAVADSGTIMLASYMVNGPPTLSVPRGNSVLYVDNLNFDKLINSVDDKGSMRADLPLFHPNPARDFIYLEFENRGMVQHQAAITIYNDLAGIVLHKILRDSETSVDLSDLPPGVYFLVLENDHAKTINKLVKIE